MSYKNDSLLTIVDKYSKARGDAVVDMYETYDRLRDISISGSTVGSPGFGPTASFMLNLARLVAPSSFMPVIGDSSLGLPGTSYFSASSGSNIFSAGSQAAFGIGKLGTYSGLPSGGAAGINSISSELSSDYTIGGTATGGASSVGSTLVPAAGVLSGLSAGYNNHGSSILLPAAGFISGVGGLMASIGPYFGPFGVAASIAGNMASGDGGAALNAYQSSTGRILNNADVTLSNRVRNIETIVKQIDAQGQVLQKMIKDSVEVDSKALQNL